MHPQDFAAVVVVLLLVGLPIWIHWLVMLVDLAKRRFDPPLDKLFWLAVMLVIPLVGQILYHVLVKRSKPRPTGKHEFGAC